MSFGESLNQGSSVSIGDSIVQKQCFSFLAPIGQVFGLKIRTLPRQVINSIRLAKTMPILR